MKKSRTRVLVCLHCSARFLSVAKQGIAKACDIYMNSNFLRYGLSTLTNGYSLLRLQTLKQVVMKVGLLTSLNMSVCYRMDISWKCS